MPGRLSNPRVNRCQSFDCAPPPRLVVLQARALLRQSHLRVTLSSVRRRLQRVVLPLQQPHLLGQHLALQLQHLDLARGLTLRSRDTSSSQPLSHPTVSSAAVTLHTVSTDDHRFLTAYSTACITIPHAYTSPRVHIATCTSPRLHITTCTHHHVYTSPRVYITTCTHHHVCKSRRVYINTCLPRVFYTSAVERFTEVSASAARTKE